MEPWLPIGPCKAPAIEYGGAMACSLAWVAKAPSKDRERGGALALEDHHLMMQGNNQPRVGVSNRGDGRVEAHWGGIAWEDVVSLFWPAI